MNQKAVSTRLKALQRVLRLSRRLVDRFPNTPGIPGVFVLLFFAGALDTTRDVSLLLSCGRFSLIPVGLRSLLEALANVRLLAADSENYRFLDARTLKTLLGITKYEAETLASGRASPKVRRRQKEVAELAKTLSDRYSELVAKKYRPLTEREKFERADMLNLHLSTYQILSMQPHHNIQNLFNRYIRVEGENQLTATFDTKGTVEGFQYWYSMTCLMYSELVRSVCEFFKIDVRKDLQQITDSLRPFVREFPADYASVADL